ncbi:MAG TPA: DUF5666 domain-containing protein [Ktedonobacteraceae bacterium]|nr:DUF5666 domain-containing protein [Ktedonobacteraceae bacterium]
MHTIKNHRVQTIVLGIIGVVLMVLFSACSGVVGNGGPGTSYKITGQVQTTSSASHSVTLTVNGQSITITGLTDQELAALQPQVGKTYTIIATQNSDGSYTISSNSTPVVTVGGTTGIETDTPEANQTPDQSPTGNVQGSIQFIGKVQSVSSSSITVAMPNGTNVTMSIVNGQTDMSDFNGALPSNGQLIKAEANANTDGSYTATKLGVTDSGDVQDQNVVTFQGTTTSAVGSDNIIHFTVGSKSYSYAIGSGADLGDFNNSAQSIGNNQAVKLDVTFNGATGTVTKVSNANN